MKKLKIVGLFVLTTLLTGCVNSFVYGDYSVLSTQNIDITHSKNLIRGNVVKSGDFVPVVGIFPLGRISVDTAIQQALRNNKCAVGLTDVKLRYTEFWLVILGGAGLSLDGRLLLDKSISGCQNR